MLLSAVSSNVLMAPRVLFAMSRDGLFWRGAREVNRGGTPDIALLISSMLAAAFIVTDTFETVIAKLAFFFVANYTLSFMTLFVLRRREPRRAAAVSRVGASVHHRPGARGLGGVPHRRGGQRPEEQPLVRSGLLLLSFPVYLVDP